MRVIISAGGTGGHIYPALGVIEKLKEDKNNEILYIGTKNRMESKIIPDKNIPYVGIEMYGLTKNIFKDVKDIYCIISAYKKCKKIMKEFKPDYVIGFGGYVTYPVILAAHKLGIKTAIHEQNKIPGKTNKHLSKYADITFTSFESSKGEFKNKVIVSGNPCAENALTIKAHDKTKLGFTKNKKLIIIVMGSLGSETVNNRLKDFITSYKSEENEILFITGKDYYEDYKNMKVSKNIKLVPEYEDLSGLIKSSDLVISRAGASTISELLSLDKPSILIPSPYVANNHQYYNALDLKEKGLCYMLEQKDLTTENLNNAIDYCFNNYSKMVNNLCAQKKMKASTIIVEEMKK